MICLHSDEYVSQIAITRNVGPTGQSGLPFVVYRQRMAIKDKGGVLHVHAVLIKVASSICRHIVRCVEGEGAGVDVIIVSREALQKSGHDLNQH